MEAKPIIPGLNRTENDAATALGVFLLGMLAVLCTTVLALDMLSGLPSIMAYGVLFAVMVFAVVCAVAFVRTDLPTRHNRPPELKFHNPPRRARRAQPQRLQPLR